MSCSSRTTRAPRSAAPSARCSRRPRRRPTTASTAWTRTARSRAPSSTERRDDLLPVVDDIKRGSSEGLDQKMPALLHVARTVQRQPLDLTAGDIADRTRGRRDRRRRPARRPDRRRVLHVQPPGRGLPRPHAANCRGLPERAGEIAEHGYSSRRVTPSRADRPAGNRPAEIRARLQRFAPPGRCHDRGPRVIHPLVAAIRAARASSPLFGPPSVRASFRQGLAPASGTCPMERGVDRVEDADIRDAGPMERTVRTRSGARGEDPDVRIDPHRPWWYRHSPAWRRPRRRRRRTRGRRRARLRAAHGHVAGRAGRSRPGRRPELRPRLEHRRVQRDDRPAVAPNDHGWSTDSSNVQIAPLVAPGFDHGWDTHRPPSQPCCRPGLRPRLEHRPSNVTISGARAAPTPGASPADLADRRSGLLLWIAGPPHARPRFQNRRMRR